jgi:hypothetical protein
MSSPEPSLTDLHLRGINDMQAADLRMRFTTFAEDWDSPEMNQYDDYDSATIPPKSAEATFRQGWLEAQSGQTHPVSELWNGIDAD